MPPQDAASLRAQRAQAREQGRYDEALRLGSALLERFPAEVEAEDWFQKGVCHYYLDQNPEAIAAYDHYLEMEPNSPQALANKGICLLETGEAQAAFACFRAALAINPNVGPLWAQLGFYHLRHVADRPYAALKASQALRRAVALMPDLAREWVPYRGSLARIEVVVSDFSHTEPLSLDQLLTP